MSIRHSLALRATAGLVATTAIAGLTLATAPLASAELSGRGWYGLPTTMTISVPQVYSGVPVTLTATLSNTVVTGGVQFWANDPAFGLGPIVRASNGTASFTFMPGPDGVNQWQTFGATFWPDVNQGTTEATAPTVTMRVLPNKGKDSITMSPTSFTLGNGLTQVLSLTTASGAAPAVAVQGGCTLSGTSITGTASSGTCSVFASTTGTNGYLPSSTSWAISLGSGKQSARITAPKSGDITKGSSIVLGSSGQTTSVGEAIAWRISSGAKSCRVDVSGGKVYLRTKYSGRCTAVASATGKNPEYRAFTATRTYKVVIPG